MKVDDSDIPDDNIQPRSVKTEVDKDAKNIKEKVEHFTEPLRTSTPTLISMKLYCLEMWTR